MADLITRARALYALNNLSTTSNENTTLDALITACSKAIRRHCGREFDSQQFDELYDGFGQERLLLRQLPVISVARVAHGPAAVLEVTNAAAANQRATVAVTSTGLTLTRVASGTVSTDTSVTWAGNATLQAVVTAVDALGNGWDARLTDAANADRASADLRAVQGALNAKDVWAPLRLHLQELSEYEVDMARGWLERGAWWDTLFGGEAPVPWRGGPGYWRVIYTAGYATVPEDVQEACAQWVATLFWQSKRDPGLRQEQVPGVVARAPYEGMPPGVRALLAPYRDLKIVVGGV